MPKLFQNLKSENQDIVFNAVSSLEGLIDDFPDERVGREKLMQTQVGFVGRIITKLVKVAIGIELLNRSLERCLDEQQHAVGKEQTDDQTASQPQNCLDQCLTQFVEVFKLNA